MFNKNRSLCLVALGQALGVVLYVALVALFINNVPEWIEPPVYVGIILMLTLLVFSAAITGVLVFGYAVYLAWQKETKKALRVLGLTLL